MSLSKFLTNTIVVTPAIGGGGYAIYEEMTKEKTVITEDSSSEASASPQTTPTQKGSTEVREGGSTDSNTQTKTQSTKENVDASVPDPNPKVKES